MEKGDLLVLASDGVTDAADAGGRMYEEERFVESIRRHTGKDVAGFAKALYQDISRFTADGEVNDDITILALGRSA
jgi:sigma-B regulation protein RsbU (phosphoserine phosphatase)